MLEFLADSEYFINFAGLQMLMRITYPLYQPGLQNFQNKATMQLHNYYYYSQSYYCDSEQATEDQY